MKGHKKSPLLIIFLVVFLDLVGFGIVIPILPYYAKAYGASATTLGWLMTSYSGLQFFFAPLWGRLSDRVGRRPVLLLSMAGTALSMALLGLAERIGGSENALVWLFIGRAFAGICGANISTATAYIADVTSPEDRAKGMGLVGAAFGLGFIFGPAIGGVLSRFGYSAPMFAAAGLGLANLLFATARLREPPGTAELRERNRTKRFDWGAFRETLGDARTRYATVAFLLITLGVTQMEVVFALFMQARHGYDAEGAGWLLAFMGVVMVAVQGGAIGRLSRRYGELKLVVAGTVLMAAGLVVMAQSSVMGPVFLAMTLLALGNGFSNPSLSSLASKGARPERRGATMGIYQSAGSLARVVGPPVAGWLYDGTGMKAPLFAAAALMLVACALSVGALLQVRRWIREATGVFRSGGFKALIKSYGWRMMALFFMYYLVRDVTLYILLPWMAARGVLSFR